MVVVGTDSHTPILGPFGVFATGIGFTEMAVAFATGKVWLKVPSALKFSLYGRLSDRVTSKDVILKIVGDLGTTGALYKALEFDGPGLEGISLDARMTVCCMACEVGGKTAVMSPSKEVEEYVRSRTDEAFVTLRSDPNAEYEAQYEYDLDKVVPMVAVPPHIDDVRPASELRGVKLDQVFIGSCINAKAEDLQITAEILRGKRVHPRVRMVITPVSQAVYKQALQKGWMDVFVEAGAAIVSPTCGACIGGHAGLLAKGEVCASTGNRNWRGRMGSVDAEVYMMGPATAAASAIKGEICDPRDI
jgi:3-isopropylmalate/(R)-2-methylmalate dehydratase large subunit